MNSSGFSGLKVGPRKIIVVRAFIRIMLVYSAIKNNANGPAAYSTLKPDTSSDSPSVRSKGARLVSANVEINHIKAKGQNGIINHICSCDWDRVVKENDPFIVRIDKIIIASVTSYEIVWATARIAPIREYFEFDAHPDHRIEYTVRLDRDKMNRAPKLRFVSGWGIGSGIQRESANVIAKVGAKINREIDEVEGRKDSLVKSFMASANGCKIP